MINKSQVSQTILHKNQDDSIFYNRQNAATLQIYDRNLEKKVKQELTRDSVVQNIIENIINNLNFEFTNKILIFQSLIYIFTRCKQEMINDYHESRVHEHQEFNKIIERIFKIYYFLKMRKQIEDTIRKCNMCI